ncbi:glutamate-ammonia-ligase adenylyltransferase [Actibacterium atlanticum]|uniref:Glutamate-ammonia-ligase adenylyltransferase n=1 Tax=Actibacterium atlanticum TaxID=1461693 RepID=A0A058ZRF5_9RHOB|nr:glutamine-synthetase adenylyltransferase [Actibacterium atlanticum]KCV83446.1 glutamate-ammonia-ligase adenylyltransferase [Actibacterium atlanticum]
MKFTQRITRAPIAYDAELGAALADPLLDLPPELREVLQGTAGCSPYLKNLMGRESEWLAQALAGTPEEAMNGLLADVRALPLDQLKVGMRQAKRRGALLIALADLAGVWALEPVTTALTNLADTCIDTTIKALLAPEVKRGKLPGMGEDDIETACGMVAMAMGKQGAYELNYSSDIDLICLFDQTRFDPKEYQYARASFIRVTRKMATMLSDITGDGYVFRTDLRLRPDASVTPVCLAMEPAERYYESLGRTWERAAHIKARPCAGDLDAGWAYLERLRPFIWRKHLDFAAIQDAHDMRMAIRDHKGLHGDVTIEGHNLKLGQGGIREIEFFTQTRQLIAGGRDPDLRVRGTVEGLAKLAEKDWLPVETSDALADHYRAHREIEHRLQMVNDAQTHSMPTSADGIDRIARFCGESDTENFRAKLRDRLHAVAQLTDAFFAPEGAEETPKSDGVSDAARQIMERWPTYPALRSPRAVELFNRLKPGILARLQTAAKPEEALSAFDGFLSGLPAGVQVFSLFQANPQLVDLIVDIASTAPELARYLSRNASVLDAVIGGDFFADWPGRDGLQTDLAARLAEVGDYEGQLDTARRWAKEWHFRTGVHFLRGVIDADEASSQYADLAGAVLGALWPCVVANFAEKHGVPPGKGAVVLGMGSLGAARLTARSDLDLIVIYDADGVAESEGRRPLPARTYYARLTKALVTALSAPMAEGMLYEVDMRLRPSGNQGPVATSFQSFQTYQREEAWVWEHLALTRARVIAGDAALGDQIESFRRAMLAGLADGARISEGVEDMRRRLSEAKPAKGIWDVKLGPGRGQDIELLASTAALMAGAVATNVRAQLQAGWLESGKADVLCQAYVLFRKVQLATSLLTDKALNPSELGEGGRVFFLKATGAEEVDTLASQLEQVQMNSDQIISEVLERMKDE